MSMEVCYLPAAPLASCGEDGGVVGIAVDYVRSKMDGLGAYVETCFVDGLYAAAARGCHVIIGTLNTYEITRDFGSSLANYTVGNPYAATKGSTLFANENPGPPPFFFLEPFSWGAWLLVLASFALAGLTIRVLRGERSQTPPLRDAVLAMAGYARLFEADGGTFWEDVVSAATAVFSVVLVSIYSSNMVSRGYIATQTTPDFYSKPLLYDTGCSSKWYVDLRSGYEGRRGIDLFDERGRPNSSILDGVARGEYFASIYDIYLSGACDRRATVSSAAVRGWRTSFFPAVLTENVSADVFRAFVIDSVADTFYVGGKRPCLEGDPDGVEGLTFVDTWTGFAILGGVVAILVAWKVAAYRLAVRRGLLPVDADVIGERRIDVSDDAPSPNSETSSVKTAGGEPHTDLEAAE